MPPPAHITLPEVWEAQNNDESFKIVKGVLQGDVSYSPFKECGLEPDMRVLLKLAHLGEIWLEK